jgi:c-di-GMP-binding flagellar brake protein YcgR
MDNLGPILPFLRPRSAEISLFAWLLLLVLISAFIALIAYNLLKWRRQKRQVAEKFLHLAEEMRLDSHQADFLLQLSREKRMKNPLLLLTSVYVFDRHLGELAERLAEGNSADPILDTIAQIRTLLGFDELPVDQALRSTRQIPTGQTLMLWDDEDETEEFSPWLVVDRDERAIAIAPLLRDEQREFVPVQPGALLAARFWREGDTEYRFTTEVLAFSSQNRTALLRHVDRIERLQLRDFFRLQTHFPIFLFVLPISPAEEESEPEDLLAQQEEDEVHAPEAEAVSPTGEPPAIPVPDDAPRIAAQVANLSAGGLFLMTGGEVPIGHPLLIDPAFTGPFPLGGLLCEVVHATEVPEGQGLQLTFVDLPAAREREIVRLIYQHQIQERLNSPTAGGRGPG